MPIKEVKWSDSSKPSADTSSENKEDFQLGMDLFYRDEAGNNISAVYKGDIANVIKHTIRLEDGSILYTNDSNLQLLDQPDFSNIPKTPLDYRNEVGSGLSLQEAQALARPRTFSPLQQYLISWNHRLYHTPFRILFRLAKIGFLPKTFLECQNKTPLCVYCQFCQAYRQPWRTKGKKSGSIRTPAQGKPGDDVSVDQIILA